MPHLRTQFMSTAPRAALPSEAKPPVPYLGSGKGEANPTTRKDNKRASLISRLDPIKYEVDPLRVANLMSQTAGSVPNRKYSTDEHTRGLVRDDNTTV